VGIDLGSVSTYRRLKFNSMNPTITYLSQVRNNLEYVDYDIIYRSISDIQSHFIPTAILPKGAFIDRVRINKPGEIYTSFDQVSYIHDKKALQEYVGFGRANEPKQAVFYGVMPSAQIESPRIVGYFETSELSKELERYDNCEEVFTLSRWRILDEIKVIEMIFSEAALEVNEDTRHSLENQISKYKHLPLANAYEEQMKFFSEEFARHDIKKGEEHKYKITAAYANFLWRKSNLKSITYPSVQSNYFGQNVALLPELVDRYLKLERVGMFKFQRRNGENLPIYGFKLATDLGDNQSNFKWYDFVA
jgi:hypothetical protein